MFEHLILHIGTHKTGTSAIQRWMHNNRDDLGSLGLLYPLTGQWHDFSHHRWSNALWEKNGDGQTLEALTQSLEDERVASNCETLLLSSELLEKIPVHEDLRGGLNELLGKLAKKVTVIVFFRRQDELVESVFKQWVKDSRLRMSKPVAGFLREQSKKMDYLEIAQAWSSLSAVSEIKIETNALTRNPVEAIAEMIGRGVEKMDPKMEKIVNPSLDGRALELKWLLNALDIKEEHDNRLCKALLRTDFPSERLALFNADERAEFMSQFATSNSKLCAAYKLPNFRDETPERVRVISRLSGNEFFSALEELKRQDIKIVWQVFEAMSQHLWAFKGKN